MCAARDCRTMLLSLKSDQYEAPESTAHVVASSLPALHLLVRASNSEPCQPCVFHNLPCLPLQSLCICETCGRCLDCLLLILTVPIPSWPESISRARSSSSDIDLPHSNYHTFFLLLSIPPRSLVPAFTRCKYSIYSANGCQSIQPPPFIQHRFLSITRLSDNPRLTWPRTSYCTLMDFL